LTEVISISKIKANPNNPRLVKDDKFKKLVKSIQDFPQMLNIRPIVVNNDMVVLGGNMRLKACKEAGLKQIPIIKASDLTEDQQREFIIKDNVGYGEWDWERIANEWDAEQITEWGLDIPDFTPQNLEAEEDDYEIPDEIHTDIVLGDLFEIGPHRLLCGDSTNADDVARLMNGQKADFCFTSPPYNAAMTCAQMHSKAPKAGVGGLYVGGYSDDRTSEEYIQFNKDIFTSLFSVANENFTLCYNINYNKNSPSEYIDVVAAGKAIIPLVETIVWEKQMAVSLQGDNLTRIFEFVFVFACGKFKINKNRTECLKNLWKISNVGANHSSHKACFPVALAEEGIKNFCVHGGTIIEPFGGSGTMMVAAHQLGCKARLMELDPKYCQVIVDRMKKLDPSIEIKRNGQIWTS
jgi:DNA modification methylase